MNAWTVQKATFRDSIACGGECESSSLNAAIWESFNTFLRIKLKQFPLIKIGNKRSAGQKSVQ